MLDLLSSDLIEKDLKAKLVGISVGYARGTLNPFGASLKLDNPTNNCNDLTDNILYLYEKGVSKDTPIRKVNITMGNLITFEMEQLNLFKPSLTTEEKNLNNAILSIKNKYGKSSVLKGINLKEEATTKDRNKLIGGHNAN